MLELRKQINELDPLALPMVGTENLAVQKATGETGRVTLDELSKLAIARITGGAGPALDTLQELAAAINNDANVYNTIIALLAAKSPLASPAFTGSPNAPTPSLGDASQRLATTAFVNSAIMVGVGIQTCGELVKSGANLVLRPHKGNLLTINGLSCIIPDAGVSLAATGLSPSTLYRIYAVGSAGVVTGIEASTTARAISTTGSNAGNHVKSGDEYRTFVGLAYVTTGPAFRDDPAKRLVRSWLNRKPAICAGAAASSVTSSTDWVGIGSTDLAEFLSFAGESAMFTSTGDGYSSPASALGYFGSAVDSVTPDTGSQMRVQSDLYTGFNAASFADFASDGYHYARNVFKSGGATSVYAQNARAIGIVG